MTNAVRRCAGRAARGLAGLSPAAALLSLVPTAAQEQAAAPPDAPPARLEQLTFEPRAVTLAGTDAEIWAVAYSPDGETLATGSADKAVRLYDVAAGQLRTTL